MGISRGRTLQVCHYPPGTSKWNKRWGRTIAGPGFPSQRRLPLTQSPPFNLGSGAYSRQADPRMTLQKLTRVKCGSLSASTSARGGSANLNSGLSGIFA
jgi:hypothetical protein